MSDEKRYDTVNEMEGDLIEDEELGTTQSYVSKLEHATTDKITVRALEQYSQALGLNLVVMFQRNMNGAEAAGSSEEASLTVVGADYTPDERELDEFLDKATAAE